MLTRLRNFFTNGYKTHPEAVIVTCYYNPKNNPARLDAFTKFYETIKHLNHRIIECVASSVGVQLPDSPYITRLYTDSNLWHKEQLLNRIVAALPKKFKYVFWVDADVLFSNRNWVVDAVEQLQKYKVVQLFEHCVHLDKGEMLPTVDVESIKQIVHLKLKNRTVWKGFAANYAQGSELNKCQNYDQRGHVGFAWGARREVLDAVPLYEKALIGGADGIIAYASTGQLQSIKLTRELFADSIDQVDAWGREWYEVVQGKVGYVKGDLYHIWHGNVGDRQYAKRIKEFGPHLAKIGEKDANGLYTTRDENAAQYVERYFDAREASGKATCVS